MIRIDDKKNCSGCGACAGICPKKCLTMQADEEGFLYPQADASLCIECGLCLRACPLLHRPEQHEVCGVYGVKNHDDGIRRRSSSGGMFSLLAGSVIDEGGIVFGAAFDSSLQVCHCGAESREELAALRGSKYVQSRLGGVYAEVRSLLRSGRSVMFSGTPCQAAGLKGFLQKDYDNLIAVDIVCHGVPSPKVYNKHLAEIAAAAGEPVERVEFRNKDKGWKGGETLFYTAHHKFGDTKRREDYMRLFLNNVSIRPSCGSCAFNNRRSLADITLADYWGVDKQHPDFDDDRGVTLVIVNTEKGRRLFEKLRGSMDVLEISFEEGAEYNWAVVKSLALHPQRERFFAELDKKTLKELAAELLDK